MVRNIWVGRWVDWLHLDDAGIADGILVVWVRRVFKKVDSELGVYSEWRIG